MELAEELTLGGMLRNAEERFPERPAITYHDKSFTYRQFGAITDRCARHRTGDGNRQENAYRSLGRE